jgi:hypothetical protein
LNVFAAFHLRRRGLPAEASVISMTATSAHQADSLSRKYHYLLSVAPADRAPFEAKLTLVTGFLAGKPHEDDVVRVTYDPKTLHVAFDFVGDERFDVDAMNARSARLRKETAAMLASQPKRPRP